MNETPGSVVSFVSEDVGYVSFEITAFEDASVRMYTQNTLSSATRKLMNLKDNNNSIWLKLRRCHSSLKPLQVLLFKTLTFTSYNNNCLCVYYTTAGQDFLPIDDTFNLTRSASIVVTVNITDDDFVESHEYVGVGFESDVTLNSSQYFLFIEDNDRKRNNNN